MNEGSEGVIDFLVGILEGRVSTKESEEFINFALGFRVAAYGASTIRSDHHAFRAGSHAGKEFYPVRSLIAAETIWAAYEKWKANE